jgi:hypothetical protein
MKKFIAHVLVAIILFATFAAAVLFVTALVEFVSGTALNIPMCAACIGWFAFATAFIYYGLH